MTLYSPQAKGWSPVRESDAGNVQCAIGYVPVNTIGAINQNDVIEMVKVPLGAVVVDVMACVPNLGANVNITVGDGDDTDIYVAEVAAATDNAILRRTASNTGVPKTYSAEDTVDIKFLNANPTDNTAFSLIVMYVTGLDVTP